jgi:SnoaL-like domain
MNNVRQDIENTILKLASAWSRRDPAALAELWDEWEAAPIYVAEELVQPLRSHAAIRDYWTRTLQAAGFVSVEIANVEVQPLQAGLAAALFDLRWIGSFRGYEQPIGGDTRVTTILRSRGQGWRLIHYVEAPLAPIVYLRGLYEQFAARPPALPVREA